MLVECLEKTYKYSMFHAQFENDWESENMERKVGKNITQYYKIN